MSRSLPLLALLCASALVVGCDDSDDKAKNGADADSTLEIFPNVAGQGTTLSVHIDAGRSQLEFGATELDLGENIEIQSITVHDGFSATAQVKVGNKAALGPRDAGVSTSSRQWTLLDGFTVIEESFVLDPDNAKMGETVEVAIVGKKTDWSQDFTWAEFGDGVDVNSVTVLSPTLAIADIAVAPDTIPGRRDVNVVEGSHVVTNYDGFTVDRAVITAFFDPPQAMQGEIVEFTINGLETSFATGQGVEFWDDGGLNQDIQVLDLTILDAENMFGRMRLSNAAAIGFRDVAILGTEDILIPDGLEVLDAPPNLDNVAVSLQFDVFREIDNDSGDLLQAVQALAAFVIPLDPPCGAAPPPGAGPMPYDLNGVFPVPPDPEPVDCPNVETVEAGDFVWFESEENVVTLHREVNSAGQVLYLGRDLTLDDYRFNQVYDLHTQGDPDGIPEVLVEEVQPTVPADYYILSPDLWGDYTHDRTLPFDYTWTPAFTYPTAIFSTSISGSLEQNDEPGFAGSVPWDDGVHRYTAGELLLLNAGPVSFGASSYIEGRLFGLPFSTIQTNQSDSVLSTSASLILE